VKIASAATRQMPHMAKAGIKRRLPNATEAQVREELIELLYGPEARQRLCGKR